MSAAVAVPVGMPRHRPPVPVRGDPERLAAAARARRADWPVALVSMPFVSMAHPSIELGLLKAIAGTHGFPVDTFHLTLDFGKRIGAALYTVLSEYRGVAVGDWLFSRAAFGDAAPDPEGALLERFRSTLAPLLSPLELPADHLLAVRAEHVPAHLAELVETIPWDRYRVVGFTSTFRLGLAAATVAEVEEALDAFAARGLCCATATCS